MNKVEVPEYGTPQLLEEICRRSGDGEAVRNILAEKNLPIMPTLRWLRDHHHEDMVKAKKEQLKKHPNGARKAD